jgi:glucose-6-phosphate 1-dehydrogenase
MKSSPAGPCAMVIFGASGDLTRRKLIPALYNLAVSGLLPEHFAVVGFSRTLDDQSFRAHLRAKSREFLPRELHADIWDALERRVYSVPGELADPEAYARLRDKLEQVDHAHGTAANCLFYLATPPQFFTEVPRQLQRAGLIDEANGHWRRLIVEKPFARDLQSARDLNRALQGILDESQIYRIDHYLGKETVQNILILRFANAIFEPIWNRRYIDHVQITVAEDHGVGTRGGYYDSAGALRDMLPSHVFQLMALLAMEPPTSFAADAIRNEKMKVFSAIQSIEPDEVLTQAVRGQYGAGTMADGARVKAYREEASVPPASNTETFAALRLLLDSWRWADVPFYLRTGKRLPRRYSEIAIRFKNAPFVMFRQTGVHTLPQNELVIRIQPNEGIALSFGAKIPGQVLKVGQVNMDFCNADYFDGAPYTGYETLLYDCMSGDSSLFLRGDNLEATWSVVTPVLDVWSALPPRSFPNDAAGSWGPQEATDLMARDGRSWRQ